MPQAKVHSAFGAEQYEMLGHFREHAAANSCQRMIRSEPSVAGSMPEVIGKLINTTSPIKPF
jgi:hypothetical protein